MSEELTVTCQLLVSNGSLEITKTPGSQAIDMAGTAYSAGVQAISPSYEQIDISAELSAKGWAYFRNLDSDEAVQIGLEVSSAFYPMIELDPAEACVLPLADVDLYAEAQGTTDIDLEYLVLEE